jgi:hypothetical protein
VSYTATTIFGKRLEARLEPWMTEDLARTCDGIGQMFQPILGVAEELGEDGTTLAVAQNYVPNPSFRHDKPGKAPAGWTTSAPILIHTGATAVVESSGGPAGGPCLAVTSSGAEEREGVACSANIPVTAGVPMTWALYVRANAATNIDIGAGSGPLGATSFTTAVTTSWQRVEKTLTFSGSGIAQLTVAVTAKEVATFQIAQVIAPTQTYFDGDAGTGDFWAGKPGDSTSSHVTGYLPAWGRLLDPEICPTAALPYLAQFVGVTIPHGTPEAEARALILAEAGLERGTTQSIETAIERVLGSEPFKIQERTALNGTEAAFHFNVIVGTGKSSVALKEAIEAVKPGGVMFSIIEGKGMWLQATKTWATATAGKSWAAIKEGEY